MISTHTTILSIHIHLQPTTPNPSSSIMKQANLPSDTTNTHNSITKPKSKATTVHLRVETTIGETIIIVTIRNSVVKNINKSLIVNNKSIIINKQITKNI